MYWSVAGMVFFFFQAEDGIRDLVRSRGLGDVYKRQMLANNGPGWKTKLSVARWKTLTPTRSVGSRSGVNLSLIHI